MTTATARSTTPCGRRSRRTCKRRSTGSSANVTRHHSQSAPGAAAVLSTDTSKPKLYERVEFYSNKNPEMAMQQLRLMENRVGLIVPVGDDYANQKKGNAVTSERTTDFMVLIMDK